MEIALGDGAWDPDLKKCAISCTVLRNFVHFRNTMQFSAQSQCDKSDSGSVIPIPRAGWPLHLLAARPFKGMGHVKHAIFSKGRSIDLQPNRKAR